MEDPSNIVHCVSTMHKDYYDSIGKLMVHTWKECTPSNYRLHLYLEEFNINDLDNRIVIEDWNTVLELYKVWEDTRFSDRPRHQKFTLKALSQIALMRKLNSGKMFWLDADLLFLSKLPDNFFDTVLNDYPLASWGKHSFESGTVWFNLDHPDWPSIQQEYEGIYIGDKGLPEGERWLDGELLGRAVKDSNIDCLDLRPLCTTKTSTPLNYSWIGNHIRHFKAKRKNHLISELELLKRHDLIGLL